MLVSGQGQLNSSTPAAPSGDVNVTWQQDSSGNISAYAPLAVESFGITIDNAGSALTTGSKGYLQLPYAGTITEWTLLADQSGSVQLDIKKGTYAGFPTTASIVASAPPKITTAQKATDSTLTGWTKTFAAGDVMEFSVTSATTITRVNLIVWVQRT